MFSDEQATGIALIIIITAQHKLCIFIRPLHQTVLLSKGWCGPYLVVVVVSLALFTLVSDTHTHTLFRLYLKNSTASFQTVFQRDLLLCFILKRGV